MPRTRPVADVRNVLALKDRGWTDREVSRETGVPVNTIRLWRNHGLSQHASRSLSRDLCPDCGADPHKFQGLPAGTYAYLLAIYLGDGYLEARGSSWCFHIALDAAYPGIIESCCDAIETLRGGHRPKPRPDKRGPQCVRISSSWKQWGCLFPQHAAGRKHQRRIELVQWQRDLVDAALGDFLRGLIHTDGWRGVNRVYVKGRFYEYPRYQFSNRSDDIRRLFTDACDKLSISWRPWTRYHVSIARRESVARLDEFVGPKW
jgi:hypothetical protein